MSTSRPRVQATSTDAAVTPLELFFDLVFVYALTQVTGLLASRLDARGLTQGMVVLALVWWSWVGYSWLGNFVKADEGVTRGAFFLVMAVMFVASLAIPESFDDLDGGLSGPMVLAVCYALVRIIHIGLYAYGARKQSDGGLLAQLGRFGAVAAVSIVLMIVGAALGGDAQLWFWIGAMLVDYVGTQAIGAGGWRLYAPRHFAERHGLIIIIALGESIVSIGVGASTLPVATPLIMAAVLGIFLVAAKWWIYFDVTALAAERRLTEVEGVARTRLARDSYTYLHLPMVAGIVLAALGLKKVLSYVAGDEGHDWTDALHGIPPWSLHLGPAIYLMALVLMRRINVGTWGRSRPVAIVALAATAPLGAHIGALADLALVTAILAALVAWEAIRYRDTREQIRHQLHGH